MRLYSYTLPQWLLFFLFYCFIGWCIESAWVSLHQKRFVNRGFLHGPVIPIYGSGAIAILFATLAVREHLALVFLLGMLAATALEYVTGAAMEAALKVRYWDYSDKRYNLHGYICLNTSLAWGLLSVVLVRFVHRPVERIVLSMPADAAQALSFALSGLFLADLVISLRAALDLRRMLEQLEAYSERAGEEVRLLQKRMEVYSAFKLDEIEQKHPESIEALQRRVDAMERFSERLEQSENVQKLRTDLAVWKARRAEAREGMRRRLTWDKRTLLRNNPSASSRRYAEPLRLLRERMMEERKKKQETTERWHDSPSIDA